MSPVTIQKRTIKNRLTSLFPSLPSYNHYQLPDQFVVDYIKGLSDSDLMTLIEADVITGYSPLAALIAAEIQCRRNLAKQIGNRPLVLTSNTDAESIQIKKVERDTAKTVSNSVRSNFFRHLTTIVLTLCALMVVTLIFL